MKVIALGVKHKEPIQKSRSLGMRTEGKAHSKNGEGGGAEVVRVRVSNPSLTEGLKTLKQSGLESAQGQVWSKNLKEKNIKDISNLLEARPIKLKPNRARIKLGGVSTFRETSLECRAQEHGPDRASSGLLSFHFGDRSGGPNPSFLPDPIQLSNSSSPN